MLKCTIKCIFIVQFLLHIRIDKCIDVTHLLPRVPLWRLRCSLIVKHMPELMSMNFIEFISHGSCYAGISTRKAGQYYGKWRRTFIRDLCYYAIISLSIINIALPFWQRARHIFIFQASFFMRCLITMPGIQHSCIASYHRLISHSNDNLTCNIKASQSLFNVALVGRILAI